MKILDVSGVFRRLAKLLTGHRKSPLASDDELQVVTQNRERQ